jgi:hypothetical protein
VSFALLHSAVAISRDATRSRAAKEGERHRERQAYGCAAAHGELMEPRDHMQVASAARSFAGLSALASDSCPGRFATMTPVTSALATTRPVPITVSFAAFHA